MSNLEVWNMTLSKEREIAYSRRRLERQRHLHDAEAQGRRPAPAWTCLPRRAWHAIVAVLLAGGTGSRFRRGTREAHATTATDPFLTYRPHEF